MNPNYINDRQERMSRPQLYYLQFQVEMRPADTMVSNLYSTVRIFIDSSTFRIRQTYIACSYYVHSDKTIQEEETLLHRRKSVGVITLISGKAW